MTDTYSYQARNDKLKSIFQFTPRTKYVWAITQTSDSVDGKWTNHDTYWYHMETEEIRDYQEGIEPENSPVRK